MKPIRANHFHPRARRTTLASVAALCAFAAAAPAHAASKRDSDRDGLSAKAERKHGTNPNRADTDRDRLKDGREVRIGSNPRRADTDGDGVRDGREVRRGSDPLKDESKVEGSLVAIGESSVTILDEDGVEIVVAIDGATELEAPDRDGSGDVTLADFQVGDPVEARLSADGSVALKLEVEFPQVRGILASIQEQSVTIVRRGGVETTVGIDANTKFRAPSHANDGQVTLADFRVGDRVKAKLSLDGTVATELKLLPPKARGKGKGRGKGQAKGKGPAEGKGKGPAEGKGKGPAEGKGKGPGRG